jgi:8-oxo-dGTP pyrophosphatase MutT (NUDIX family)
VNFVKPQAALTSGLLSFELTNFSAGLWFSWSLFFDILQLSKQGSLSHDGDMDLRSHIHTLLQRDTSQRLSRHSADFACVAILCRGTVMKNLEIGYILRASRNEYRWSGQIAFPGGRAEKEDADDVATATRETHEEIGLTLTPEDLLGSLDDIQARQKGTLLDFCIRPFVFWAPVSLNALNLNPNEVADFFWIPFSELTHSDHQTTLAYAREMGKIELPATQFPKDRKLWGLSYMITQNLISRLQEGTPQ